jgi:putative ABC transport system permease protein
MLSVVLGTLRGRWVTLTGTFVALALGVALIATMGLGLAATLHAPGQHPERLAGAPVVVRGPDEVRIGDHTRPLAQPPGVPAEVVRALAATAPTTVDRSFPISDGLTGHPWSVAAYGGYRITAGHQPRNPDEVVIAGAPSAVGAVRSVRTPAGVSSRTVVGVVPPSGFEQPMFFLDSEAAKLSPRVDDVVVRADPGLVRAVVAGAAGVQVLTGDDRRRARTVTTRPSSR